LKFLVLWSSVLTVLQPASRLQVWNRETRVFSFPARSSLGAICEREFPEATALIFRRTTHGFAPMERGISSETFLERFFRKSQQDGGGWRLQFRSAPLMSQFFEGKLD
jgi:hypothetical protein